ncbi:RHS repeat-associated core domain-containing protein [Winogradskyella undariae]|uniref:DUF6443 domain-containing protein n=1 Tax=Winogradskyella undariae TaxID=1285465 RepID=UPI00156B44F6|nr:DUF6443 domain-containing protein [Winogradskyella undariae]NRR91374.1 RHS repeat-associated core domain-containing protein [Winogradskyella undariae]
MKKLLYALIAIFVSNLVLAQTDTENYVKSTTYQVETTDGENESGTATELTPDDKQETVTYFDGLGRPIQSVSAQAGGEKQDIITPIAYDEFGRQIKDYLPIARDFSNNSSIDPLRYHTGLTVDSEGGISALNTYYSSKYPDEWIGVTPNPYSHKELEASPLGRVLEQAAPGKDWAIDSGHTIKFVYDTNGFEEVKLFSVNHPGDDTVQTSLVYDGYYLENELYKTITKDENWISGNNHTTEEFKNKQGQVVLKRTYESNEAHDTYYVYDDYGNLTYVLPPEASDEILIAGEQNFRVASQTNYSWVDLVNVDAEFAEAYNKALSDYDNQAILNADVTNEYEGQGGYTVTTFSNSDLVTLNISFSALEALELKKGELLSLKDYGVYKDTELGALKGANYDYYFSIRNNAIYVEGSGKVSAINESYSSTQILSYELDYTWPMLTDVDSDFAKEFDNSLRDYANQNNLSPLSIYIDNDYGAQGGLQILVDDDDNVTLNFNINSNVPLSLNKDLSIALGLKRRLSDRTLGTVSGQDFSYDFYIKDNVLYARGEGLVTAFNGNIFSSSPVIANPTIQEETVEGLCYIYHYDLRNRLIEKKIPGKDWEHIIYNKLDMPILTQDGKQSIDGKWLFTKYDVFGRVAYTGLYSNDEDRSALQDLVDNQSTQFETKTTFATIMYDGTAVFYTADAFPLNKKIEILTINYYDDYNFDIPTELEGFQNTYNQNVVQSTKSLATGSKVRVLDTDLWITSVSYYDDKARPIYMESYNAYLNSIDKVATQLDFVGKVIETTAIHKKDNNAAVIVKDNFTYDHAGRLLTQVQIIGDHEELIVNNHYDELGQLVSKNVGGIVATSEPESSNGLQIINYGYNIRGWLKTINKDNLSDNDLFDFELRYNNPITGTALFNGNISETYWQTANDNNTRSYEYYYDALNRIKKANYIGDYALVSYPVEIEDYSLNSVSYDKNGNILKLSRTGLDEVNGTIGLIDKLIYNYAPMSNQLIGVYDSATKDGFKDNDSEEIDYLYDINGNMTQDLNKGIIDIAYNHLNLPTKLNIEGDDERGGIYYKYDATGVKLEKVVENYNTGKTKTTQYAGNYIYEQDNEQVPNLLKFFSQPEGYVESNNNGGYDYVYQYKDHLGNIRLSYSDADNNGSVDSSEIIEEKNYYPFGLQHKGYNNVINGTEHPYGFNGKEEQNELGLEWLDFGARNYDASLGRWFSIDALAEFYSLVSPYNYSINNPVKYTDPDGMAPQDVIIEGSAENKKAFLEKINKDSTTQFGIRETTGELYVRNPKKVEGTFAENLNKAIKSENVQTLKLVDASESVMIDAFNSGKVDMGDMLSGNANTFKDNVLHFVMERNDIEGGFDKNKDTASRQDFNDAHQAGIDAEVDFIKETFGEDLNIEFKGEGFDNSSLKVGEDGTGSVNYVFDFGDVKLNFNLKVITGEDGEISVTNEVLKNEFVKN